MPQLDEILKRLQEEPSLIYEFMRAERFVYLSVDEDGEDERVILEDVVVFAASPFTFMLDDDGRWHVISEPRVVEIVYPAKAKEYFSEMQLFGQTALIKQMITHRRYDSPSGGPELG